MGWERDLEWAEGMRKRFPPRGYVLTLTEGIVLMQMEDRLYSITAAYNYGFMRGERYGRKERGKRE